MQKRSRMPRDTNQLGHLITGMATGEAPAEVKTDDGKNAAAVALGRLGGLKGSQSHGSRSGGWGDCGSAGVGVGAGDAVDRVGGCT
jgi:hypothetical protein